MKKSEIEILIDKLQNQGVKVIPYVPMFEKVKAQLEVLKKAEPTSPKIKKLQVLKNGYGAVSSMIGRIYPEYKQAKNFRWMTSNPNIQSVTKLSSPNSPRACILPEAGSYLASFDVSQGDVRIMAEYSKNEALIDYLNQGADVHTSIAEQMKVHRDIAKQTIFATMYGLRAKNLAKSLSCEVQEAERLQGMIREIFEGLENIQALFARGGAFMGLFQNFNLDDFNKNTRLANVVASTLAQYIEHCILHTNYWIQHEKLEDKICLYIINHDELIFNVDNTLPLSTLGILKNVMEKCVNFPSGTQIKINVQMSKSNYDKGSFVEVK